MGIDPNVQLMADAFNFDPAFLQAKVIAEGGPEAFIRAVKCSEPSVVTFQQSLRVGARSLVHSFSAFLTQTRAPLFDWGQPKPEHGDFVLLFFQFHGAKWAPYPAPNDPKGLNKFWSGNATKAFYQLKGVIHASGNLTADRS